MPTFTADQPVRHPQHGEGRVIADLGVTVVVRFGVAIEQVEATELSRVRSINDALADGQFDDALASLSRAQALAIRSVNDQWGVFSRSRVQLLPHQLWVCRQVTRTWPTRWLVADDVGLGKTIEAGLIVEPLLSSGRVRRLLVLTPARLVGQWRARLKTMFDIRLQEYAADLDRGRINFWETSQQVVASFHTVRMKGARERLLTAEPWDLIIVDEAHHFQAQERTTTLAFSLLQALEDAGKVKSLVLFTGTPHRGKDYSFMSLMQLVRPDLFDPEREIGDQLPDLHKAMIRNNKALVTDLQGNKLFRPVATETVDYGYSAAEAAFYGTMSDFIIDGRAYALSLTGRQQTARMLLLIALQKLAASSIAAIGAALERRRATLARRLSEGAAPEESEPETLDEAAEAEESRPDQVALLLMKDEIERLDEILELARKVGQETKVTRLLALIETRLPSDEPVLLFTEYKATQALVFSSIEKRFGSGCIGFINGDERLVVAGGANRSRMLQCPRDMAAADFNAGQTRFLISTEAGGEGIDLQERCATLVHVDLPWNPMRLHQRVGRLNRYGQKRPVQVFLLRNPETVEARIWALLQEKLARIQSALSASMEEAEDISQLVIGMRSGGFFDELFAEGLRRPSDSLSDWFNAQTVQFGGTDAVEAVRALVGNVARYDFQSSSAEIPKLDLPALEPFFRHAMQLANRRVTRSETGLSVATPESWRGSPDLKGRYDGLVLERTLPADQAMVRLLGVGHPLMDRALTESNDRQAFLARVKGLSGPLVIALAEDEITGTGATVHRVIFGVDGSPGCSVSCLRDWELLSRINELQPCTEAASSPSIDEVSAIRQLIGNLLTTASQLALPFRCPRFTPLMAMLPGS
ncbi:helicase SNF2 [Rhodoblastus acidophilus]|uniref:Helicase SNF2 n=1 Tax=Rhodoblastus acidophilus TaxID=1074 RepID=A0A6N8DNA5_RHOAC|nr:DEAD/DEAH box helicase [Rhodoblastus acidophilus]MCW2275299.1 ERCC4-related helicase [Rhodoblastus acidophilus]MTV31808.1 helicase SNF2 [Rhodoblastus acidophilus]